MKKKFLLLTAGLLLAGGLAFAQTIYPLQSSVTGSEYIKNEANPTSSFFTTAQIKTYIGTGAMNFVSGLVSFGATTPVHLATAQTTAPALTSCGGGTPAISGTDTAGIVTMGTNATGCVITFNVAYTGVPYCVVSWIATPLASQSYVTAAASITLTQTSTSGNKVQYICMARSGG